MACLLRWASLRAVLSTVWLLGTVAASSLLARAAAEVRGSLRTSFQCPQMEKEGHKCTSIEGGMDKQARDKVVKEFRWVDKHSG